MNLNYSVSIKKNTNKIISSSEDKFSGISNGTLIRIDNDPYLYTVQSKGSYIYIKNFNVHDSQTLIIDDNTDINLQNGDLLKITFKEYEAKFLIDILKAGSSYVLGDKARIVGGSPLINISDGSIDQTILEVSETSEIGGVKSLNIVNNGKYTSIPANPIETISNRGNGLQVELKYIENPNRSFIERTISQLYFSDGKTFITLDYSLPPNINNGKLSVDKNYLLLTSEYLGETKRNSEYSIFRDFTPNLRMPLLLRNSQSFDIVLNKALMILDKEIQDIKDLIKKN